ncbi:MAG: hypothetical protein AB1601_00130 [Planctomycetota bacterium]
MELARHTDYRLTASVYTDRRVLDPFGAVAKLPECPTACPDANEQRRTGTDDPPVGPRDRIRDQIPAPGVRPGALRSTASGPPHTRNTAERRGKRP